MKSEMMYLLMDLLNFYFPDWAAFHIIDDILSFIALWGFLLGAIQAFFGYKLLRIWIVISGVFVGTLLGFVLGGTIGSTISISATMGMSFLGLITGAILGGVIAYKFWKIGVFIMCFQLWFLLAFFIFSLITSSIASGFLLGVIFGIVGGSIAVQAVKPFIITITSVINGLTAGLSLSFVDVKLGILMGAICVFGGFYFQCATNGNVFGIGKDRLRLTDPISKENCPTAEKVEKTETLGSSQMDADNESSLQQQNIPLPVEDGNQVQAPVQSVIADHILKKNSKNRAALTDAHIRTRNDREYYFVNSPLTIPQLQIADIDSEGNLGLFLSFQNLAYTKRIIAIYVDINCYNVLKEKIKEISNQAFLDLSIDCGEIKTPEKPIHLPDNSIRKCEIIPRHVVFSDESIWSYKGSAAFFMTEEQPAMKELPSNLLAEFKKEITRLSSASAKNFQYSPVDLGDYWFCGCGQINIGDKCVCCGIEKQKIFEIYDEDRLQALYEDTLEKQRLENERQLEEMRRIQQEREAERRRKIEEVKNKAKFVLNTATVRSKETVNKIVNAQKAAKENFQNQSADEAGNWDSTAVNQNNPLLVCPHCGNIFSPGDKFCVSCGKILWDHYKTCGACGFVNTEDSNFCSNCGRPL